MRKRALSLDLVDSANGSPDEPSADAPRKAIAHINALLEAVAAAAAAPPRREIMMLSEEELVERFDIDESTEVGAGSDGHVFPLQRARDHPSATAATTVVKRIDMWANVSSTEDRAERAAIIDDEVHIHRTLSPHPHVVQILDAVRTDRFAYIVLERCEGSLRERWLQPRSRWLTPREVARELLVGLEYMHSRFIIHLDVKPDNMLVTADGHIRLADFGHSARFASAEEAARGYRYCEELTTRWWRSPEAALASYVEREYGGVENAPDMRITAAADVWAAACVIAESFDELAHAPVFQAESNDQLLERMLRAFTAPPRGQWPLWDEMVETRLRRAAANTALYSPLRLVGDASACALLDGMMRLVPSMRFSAANALEHPFFA